MTPGDERNCTFDVLMAPCTQTLCRLIGMFAQRDVPLAALTLTDVAGGQRLTITTAALDRDAARIVAAKMCQVVAVRAVTLCDADGSERTEAVGNVGHALPPP